jgi:hypothetical protein
MTVQGTPFLALKHSFSNQNPIAMKQTIRSLPKTRLFIAGLLLFSLFFVHQSCTKIDTDAPAKLALTDAEVTQKFFALPANAPVAVRRAVDEMKKRNSQSTEFVKAFVRKNGYPLWDKVTVAVGTDIDTRATSSAMQEGDTLIVVPVLQDSSSVVKSFINITLNGEVSLAFYRGGDYSAYSYDDVPEDSINADKAAIQIMWLNYKVFGATKFIVNDDKLFMEGTAVYTGPHPRIVKIDPPTAPVLQGRFLMVQICNQVPTAQGCSCWHHDITQCTCTIPNCCWHQSCWYIYFPPYDDSPGGSGGGSGDPTGGGGTTPGGDFPCASSQGRTIGIADPCGGSSPPPIYPVPPVPPVSPVNDSIPNILSRACDRQMDSLYNWGMNNGHIENSFILVKKNGVIYPKNYKVGTAEQTSVNYMLDPDEVLLAYFHTHTEDTVGYYRTSFDGQDLAQFDTHATELGYAAILEVGNARYAFVLEDVQKHSAFNIAKKGQHKRNYYVKLDALMAQISNGTIASEQAMIQYLGSAPASGVGFYKASRPNKNNFTKLNP